MKPETDTAEIDLQPLRETVNANAGTNAEPIPAAAQREIIVRHLNEFRADDEHAVKNTLLGSRFICRGGALLIPGPTGIGKSSFTYQAGVQWGRGKPFFGIRASRPLRVLIVQAENDDGDMAEIRDGIFRGLNLTADEQAEACQQIQVVCETIATGIDFIALLEQLVAKDKPDLVIIDPLFAYCGCNVSDQERMSKFLRNWLNPVLQAHGCGLILVHHTNKPKSGREKPDWQAGDFAYLGSGTTEIANWARAVIGIRSVGSHKVFEIVLGKRGKRAGLVDDEGEPIYSFYAKHAAVGICWEPANEADAVPGKTPRPGKEALLELIPDEGSITMIKLLNVASDKGIGKNRCRDLLAELLEDHRVYEWQTPRPGTNPLKSYSRQRQPGGRNETL